MDKIECGNCGKVIEGYNTNHVEYLLSQHQLSKQCKEHKNK